MLFLNFKGALCCFVHIAICFGSAVAAIFSLESVMGNTNLWNYLLAVPPALLGIFQIILGKCLFESPNYYLISGQNSKAAESVRYFFI